MSVTPLFISDRGALLSKLRLGGVATTDANETIDNAIQQVRVGFYDALGVTRVAQILAIESTEAASTADQILRLKANVTEVAWMRMLLLRAMPVLFANSGANMALLFNEEGLTRTAQQSELTKEINRLQTDVLDALSDLIGDKAPDLGSASVSVIGPEHSRAVGQGAHIIPQGFAGLGGFGRRAVRPC